MSEIEEVKELLATPKVISLIAHRNPDGDALGSTLAMSLLLKKLGHTTRVIMPSEYPHNLAFLPEVDNIFIFDIEHDRVREYLTNPDIIFCMDFNSLDRVDRLGEVIQFSKAKKILIDHHLDPEPFCDYYFSDTAASSTCELVFRFVQDMDWYDLLDTDIGECILTGIITDTGSFRYATNPNVYKTVAYLKEMGVDDYKVQDYIFNSAREKELRILGHCLANRMEILEEYETAIVSLTREDYDHFQIQRGDTEGIVNTVMTLRKVKLVAFIRDQPGIVKLSLRSKGDISVQEICRNHFKGGGHKNASGGSSYKPLRVVVEQFKKLVPQYMNKIEVY